MWPVESFPRSSTGHLPCDGGNTASPPHSRWTSSCPTHPEASDAYKQLPEIRRLLQEGKNGEAERLVNQTFTCKGKGSGHGSGANVPFGCYQVLGNLSIEFETSGGLVADYRRQLDLSTAVAEVRYTQNGVGYRREYFVSSPDEVGVIRLTADKPGVLSFTIKLDRPERFEMTGRAKRELLMTGRLNNGRSTNAHE